MVEWRRREGLIGRAQFEKRYKEAEGRGFTKSVRSKNQRNAPWLFGREHHRKQPPRRPPNNPNPKKQPPPRPQPQPILQSLRRNQGRFWSCLSYSSSHTPTSSCSTTESMQTSRDLFLSTRVWASPASSLLVLWSLWLLVTLSGEVCLVTISTRRALLKALSKCKSFFSLLSYLNEGSVYLLDH